MKKKLICSLLTLSLTSGAAACVFAGTEDTAEASGITVVYDGEILDFDTEPLLTDGSVMVPMRTIFENFGAKVKWEQSDQSITAKRKSKTITMSIGSETALKNETEYSLAKAPVIENGRTLVPLRAVSELLGLDVEWDGDSKTVTITTPLDSDGDAWKENTGVIDLDAMSVSGSGISAASNVITVSEGGDFTVKGTLSDGMITVNTKDKVRLRLSGANITNSSGPAIAVLDADKLYIKLEDGSVNTLTDGAEYTEFDGCIYSKDNLEIKGNGSLVINANYNNGISANDSLEISGGNIKITAVNDGIHVNETALISGGVIDIEAEGDGIQAEEIIDITGGSLNITTTGEAASSQSSFGTWQGNGMKENSETAENGEAGSSKGLKADWMLDIEGGDINISSTDHAVHCADEINFKGGTLSAASSSGKGVSAHGNVNLDGTDITITKATEGIESKKILTVNSGNIDIICSDDGLNSGGNGMSAGGGMGGGFAGEMNNTSNDTEGSAALPEASENTRGGMAPPEMPDSMRGGMAPPERPENMRGGMAPPEVRENMGDGMAPPEMRENTGDGMAPPEMSENTRENGSEIPENTRDGMNPSGKGGGRGGMGGGMSDSAEQSADSEHHIQINGGTVYINAGGDGIDSNGTIIMDGGYVVVNGPVSSGDGSIDYERACWINGGTLIAAGSAGMLENPSKYSEQYVISAYTSSQEGNTVAVKDEDGNVVMCFAPLKSFSHIYFSSPELKEGKTYTVYELVECDGALDASSGVYSVSGSVSAGAEIGSVTLGADSRLVTAGEASGGSMGGMGRGGMSGGASGETNDRMSGGASGETNDRMSGEMKDRMSSGTNSETNDRISDRMNSGTNGEMNDRTAGKMNEKNKRQNE